MSESPSARPPLPEKTRPEHTPAQPGQRERINPRRKGQVSQDHLPVTLNSPCQLTAYQQPELESWPATPQLDAGHLAVDNRGWRTHWPEIDDSACLCCNLCVLLCPDGALANTRDNYPRLLDAWCKGCGICARECPKNAIAMVNHATRPQESSDE